MCNSFATPWTIACQAPLSMRLPRILERVAISSSRGSSGPRLNPCLLHWQVDSLPLSHWGCHCQCCALCGIFHPLCVTRYESLQPVNSCSSITGVKKIVLPFSPSRTPTNMKFNHLTFLAILKNLLCKSPFWEIFLNLSLQFCLFWGAWGDTELGMEAEEGMRAPWRCVREFLLLCTLPSLMFPTFPPGNSGCGILAHLDA